nr:hypothetical protein [Myxococcota bacterium]
MDPLRRLVATVRRALLLRGALRWTALISFALGVAALAVAWFAPTWPRWPSLTLLALGPLVGIVLALRRMPPEGDLVVFVDLRLGANQAVLTAWEAAQRKESGPFVELARAQAEPKLRDAKRRDVRPRVLGRELWGIPLAAGSYAAALLLPIPPPPRPIAGGEIVRLTETEALRPLERLQEFARDEEQRRRLEELAREARALRERLEEGMEQREALDAIERLREEAERSRRPETADERRARDAAVDELAQESEMQRALAERDLESLDRAVERAAARREEADRERAREALERAAEAARAQGDEAMAESLME